MANTKSKVSDVANAEVADVADEIKETSNKQAETKKTYKAKELSPHTIVTVKNGFQGLLVYKSKRTGERFVWDSFGDEQDMELQELKNAKNSSKAFFENNWFLIDDPEVLEYLGVTKLYKYALTSSSFDELFSKKPDEVKETISRLSNGQKKSLAYRAKQLINDGAIDSIKVITALEESLSIELIDR